MIRPSRPSAALLALASFALLISCRGPVAERDRIVTYDACVDDVRRKVRYDLEYLRRQSVLEDFRIMSMTLPVMIFRKGGW